MSEHFPKRLFSAEIHKMRARGHVFGAAAGAGISDDRGAVERHKQVLEAINSLDRKISGMGEVSTAVVGDFKREIHEAANLRQQLQELSDAILQTKKEIAAFGHIGEDDDHIVAMTSQLDAVVADTEKATNAILSAAENIDCQADRIRGHVKDEEEAGWVDEIRDQVVKVFEACNFQDITGQRINKVVTTLKFIDERVTMMIAILGGKSGFDGLPPPDELPRDEDQKLLNGPQLDEEKKISQNEIDSLFN